MIFPLVRSADASSAVCVSRPGSLSRTAFRQGQVMLNHAVKTCPRRGEMLEQPFDGVAREFLVEIGLAGEAHDEALIDDLKHRGHEGSLVSSFLVIIHSDGRREFRPLPSGSHRRLEALREAVGGPYE